MGTHAPKRLPYRAGQQVKVSIENQQMIRDRVTRAIEIIQLAEARGLTSALTTEARAIVFEVGYLATDTAYRLTEAKVGGD